MSRRVESARSAQLAKADASSEENGKEGGAVDRKVVNSGRKWASISGSNVVSKKEMRCDGSGDARASLYLQKG